MGMNHSGEIANLVQIADPDFVVCTMVGVAHIENFGTLEKIAAAKEEIYQFTRESTVRVFNQDQDLTFDMMYPVAKRFPASRMLSFSGKNDEADVYFKLIESTAEGLKVSGRIAGVNGEAIVPIFGEHNIINLMAASTMAYASGMKPELIWDSLPLCKSTWGRNEFINTKERIRIIFDGYNANLDSMKALFANVKPLKALGKKVAALGQMKEVGAAAPQFHAEIAGAAVDAGFQFIYFYGENFKDFEAGLKQAGFQDYLVDEKFSDEMKLHLKKNVGPGDLLAVKGSRGAVTENYVQVFTPVDWDTK
jgi:UDP-N-acetylmuramoyl-tripeptide--D-alanyl-D-alanine ligase